MTDLKSAQHGLLQMTPDEVMENIMEARTRRRKRNTKPPPKSRKAATTKQGKKAKGLLSKITDKELAALLELSKK